MVLTVPVVHSDNKARLRTLLCASPGETALVCSSVAWRGKDRLSTASRTASQVAECVREWKGYLQHGGVEMARVDMADSPGVLFGKWTGHSVPEIYLCYGESPACTQRLHEPRYLSQLLSVCLWPGPGPSFNLVRLSLCRSSPPSWPWPPPAPRNTTTMSSTSPPR